MSESNAAVETQDLDQAIIDVFNEGVATELDEDTIKINMIAAGATFKNVTRLYNQYMIDAGHAISREDKEAAVETILTGQDLSTEEVFSSCVEALVEGIKGTTERAAAAIIRAYGKKNELEVYSKPKGASKPRSGFASKFHEALIENPRMTEEEAKAIINGEGDHPETSENVKRHASVYIALQRLANSIAEKLA